MDSIHESFALVFLNFRLVPGSFAGSIFASPIAAE